MKHLRQQRQYQYPDGTHPQYPVKPLALTVLSIVLLLGCTPRQPSEIEEASRPPEPSTQTAEPKATQTPADTGPVPPPPPAGSFLAQIPPDITAELEALQVPIAVPTYLPEGFDLVDYDTGEAASGPGGGPFYWLVYRDDQNRCFTIEYTSGGIGGVGLSQQLPIESPLFGPGYSLYYGQAENPDPQAQAPASEMFSDWLEGDSGFYRLVGAQLTMQTYNQQGCQDLPPEDAVKVIESLTYLQSEIIGDG